MKRLAISLALALLVHCAPAAGDGVPPPRPVSPAPVARPSSPAPSLPVARPASPAPPLPATSGKVWGALIHATNGKPAPLPAGTPADLKDLPRRLGKVFKYSRFEVLGAHTQDIFRQYESWVVPSKELFLKLDSKGPGERGGLKLNLQFWRLDKVLVKTDLVLRPKSPLFIGGPKWRDGQLIFVLLLTEEAKRK